MDTFCPVIHWSLLLLAFAWRTGGAPINDNFASATPLSGLTVITGGSNVGATKEPGEPNHAGLAGGASVWWRWTNTVPYTLMEVNTATSSFDTLLAVYYGDVVTNLWRVASDNDSGLLGVSRLTFMSDSTNATNYAIAVDGVNAATGSIGLHLFPMPGPANDLFANAVLITGLTNSVFGQNTNATSEAGEPRHGGNRFGRSVWWRWVATTNWVVLLDTAGSSTPIPGFLGLPNIVEAYQGTNVASLNLLATAMAPQRITFLPQIGQTYRFAIDSWDGVPGRIQLNLRTSPGPTNDAFAGAFVLSGLTNATSGDNTFATRETSEPNHGGSSAGKSLWWRWTAPTNWAVVVDTENRPDPMSLGVYTGNSFATLKTVASSTNSHTTFTATPGDTYQIAVDTAFAGSQSGSFSLRLRAVPPPANDDFSRLSMLTGTNVDVQGSLLGGRLELAEPLHAGDKASVWYRWTAPRTGRVRAWCDERVAVYTGSQLSRLTLVSRERAELFRYVSVFDAVQNGIYYIAVSGSQSQESPFQLRIDYTPLNDDVANAFTLAGISNQVQATTVGASYEFGEPEVDDIMRQNSVWWSYRAPGSGTLEFAETGNGWHAMWVYQGSSVSNLTLVASNGVPQTSYFIKCQFSCDVIAGQTYYIAASGPEAGVSFDMVLKLAPPNDSFASRLVVEPSARVAYSTTVGATREPSEPSTGSNSVWWSWTTAQPGAVILTTAGSACDTLLSVYVGNSLTSLVQVASNNDGYLWLSNGPAAAWTSLTGPKNDVISRLRLNADNGVSYKICVAVAPTNQPAGDVTLNFTKLVIDDITAATRTVRADNSVSFAANLRLLNLRNTPTSRLRIRLLARAGYSYNQSATYNCPWENFTLPEIELGTFPISFPASGAIPAGGTTQIIVEGICPSPWNTVNWGYGYSVLAVLEEEQSPNWLAQDARLILIGEWPMVSESSGPGGGVITISSALQSGSQVGFLDVKPGPASALTLGGGWRVSPTNYGELHELQPYTNYTSSSLKLAVRSTNFTIEMRPLTGFSVPPHQSIRIQPAMTTPLDLLYSVNRPLLNFDRSSGLAISGTPQTAYRIEANSLTSAASPWVLYTNLTLAPGFNKIPTSPPQPSNRVFRALWLP